MEKKDVCHSNTEKLARDKELSGWLHTNAPVESKSEVDETVDFSSMYPNFKTS